MFLTLSLLAGCDGFDGLDIGFGGHDGGRGSQADWVKPGAQPGESTAAYRDCRDTAEQATRKDADIDQDIAATRGADLQHSQIVQMRSAQMSGTTRQSADSIIASCMQQKGFVQRR
ncbi:MAG TPA: hypothetical protein VHW66_16580 [Stellaceae bacterium]|nr:hypothetical protein [Stellaceae bacterium]